MSFCGFGVDFFVGFLFGFLFSFVVFFFNCCLFGLGFSLLNSYFYG